MKFGTFGGVFTPCVLTILGVIMFLRFGQVVGNAGVVAAIGIVLVSKAITTLTSLSLSAIATNTRVKGGGAYYLISRSLGVEFGGAIGIVFFLAQAISVAMYVIGFSEAFVEAVLPEASARIVASLVNLLVFACVFIGAGWTIKVQYFILAVLGAALVSFYAGAFSDFEWSTFRANLGSDFQADASLLTMFALFFPAVTGIMAGANMSGDLESPARSIPRGTLWAVLVTGLVYLSQAVLLGGVRESTELATNNFVIKEVSAFPIWVTAGVFAATLSSSLGSMMGAPRILQALSRDHVFRTLRPFAHGSGEAREPRRATVLTFLIAAVCVALADLDAIAPIITMAFMITYGTLNLATFYEAVTGNPSYRPRFRYCHWSLSLLGALGCLVVMLLISPLWAAVAILLMVVLHWTIAVREVESRWGDLRSGVLFERARKNLLALEQELEHPKNWRPILLGLSGSGWTRPEIPVYGHWLSSGHGILSLAQVIHGEVEDHIQRRANQEAILREFIRQEGLLAFPTVVVAPTLRDGVESLVQCHGIGGLRPNTVLFGWPNDPERSETFGSSLRQVARLGRNIVSIKVPEPEDSEAKDPWFVPRGSIDVWWRGKENGALMLLLAHLLVRNQAWRTRPIRLLRVVPSEEAIEDVRAHLLELIDSSRITATPEVVVDTDPAGAIQRRSRDAALTVLGFNPPGRGEEPAFFAGMQSFSSSLNRVIFVHGKGGIELES